MSAPHTIGCPCDQCEEMLVTESAPERVETDTKSLQEGIAHFEAKFSRKAPSCAEHDWIVLFIAKLKERDELLRECIKNLEIWIDDTGLNWDNKPDARHRLINRIKTAIGHS